MPVDTSIYANVVKPANPLEMMSNLAGLQGQMQQNQLRARTMAAQQAIGSAYQQATGPDGHLDADQASALIAQNPNAAFGAEAAAANLQAQRQAQISQHQQQVEVGIRQLAFAAQTFGALAEKPDLKGSDFTQKAGDLINAGFDPKLVASELGQLPPDPGPGQPNPLYSMARQFQARTMDGLQQLTAYHQNTFVDSGNQIQEENVAPGAAQIAPIQKTLTPGEAASPIAGPVGPDGAPTTVPLGQRASMGVVQTGPSPSQQAASQVTGAGNAQRAQDLGKAANAATESKAFLGNMSGDLKQFSSGPGASQWKGFLSGVARLFPGMVDTNAVASQENFNKYQTMLAQRSFAALGGTGTDAKLDSAIHANPNEAISALGNKGIIALNKGLADAIRVKNNLWQKAVQGGTNADVYGQFENSFNQRYDPRVFQWQYLDKAGKDQVLSGMTAGEKSQFYAQQHYAQQKHWVGGDN